MSANEPNAYNDAPGSRTHTGLLWLLFLGLALALTANVYQFVKAEHLSRDLSLSQVNSGRQIARLTDAALAETELNQQRFEALKTQMETSAAATLRQARSDLQRNTSRLAKNVDQKQQDVVSQLADLKQATSSRFDDTSAKLNDTSARLSDTSTKLQDTNVKLDQVSSDVDQTRSELKRAVGDMGVLSGEIATNGKELAMLKELGERNYFEFDVSKAKLPQRIGNIQIALKKTDPKHNRFTMDVLADDQKVEKKDRTINEPVQLYVAGSRQPYEIVVNQVKKDEIIGYLATPKVKAQRAQGPGTSGF